MVIKTDFTQYQHRGLDCIIVSRMIGHAYSLCSQVLKAKKKTKEEEKEERKIERKEYHLCP